MAAGGAAMSNTGKFADRTPGIRQAGLTSALANESSSACLDYPEPPSTPEGIKKWRKSLQEPGKVLIHPGQMADRTYDAMHSRPLHYYVQVMIGIVRPRLSSKLCPGSS